MTIKPTLLQALEELRVSVSPVTGDEVYHGECKGFNKALDQAIALVKEYEGEERENGQKIVYLILPFAKGYVADNRGEANQRYIEIAENYISQDTNNKK